MNQSNKFIFVFLTFSLLLISIFISQIIGEETPSKKTVVSDFQRAKKFLRRIYKNVGVEFYCGCQFSPHKDLEGRFQIHDDCGLKSRTGSDRSFLIEWEHIVPAHAFGKNRSCWTDTNCEVSGKKVKGRKCCEGTDPVFREIEADLHNLVPAPGEINNDRGNYDFGIIPGEKRNYGICDFEVDFKEKLAEPRETIRGDIARIYLYMEKQWAIPIANDKRKLYENWNEIDPADAFEIRKNEIIERIQGRKNPFIP
ncbi:MAG: endonuclease [Leptospira sp.]|nr:endonuclease [Leptospira sp.]